MTKQYNILGKEISVTVDLYGRVTISEDAFELIIDKANKAYAHGYSKAKREEYEKNVREQIERLK